MYENRHISSLKRLASNRGIKSKSLSKEQLIRRLRSKTIKSKRRYKSKSVGRSIVYEDRDINSLRKLASSRGLKSKSLSKAQLIRKLRGGRQVKYKVSNRQSKSRAAKFERCVKKLKARGDSRYNPWAVCRASIYGRSRR